MKELDTPNNQPDDKQTDNKDSFAEMIDDVIPLKKRGKLRYDSNHNQQKRISHCTFENRRKNAAYAGDEQHKKLSDHEPPIINPDDFLTYSAPSVSTMILQDLKDGHISIDYHLDLHGYTISEVTQILPDFFLYCNKRKAQCVRIIHGKSFAKYKQGKPTMKSYVAHWLKHHFSDVLAFVSCSKKDGGTGALYVLLKSYSLEEEF